MKTEFIAGRGNIRLNKTEPAKDDVKQQETVKTSQESAQNSGRKASEIENKNTQMYHLDAVKKLIGENIQWREMRFYRHESDGKMYVDIIDKETGEVLKTVPEPEFVKIATEFKHLAGLNLNING
ncbi:MAG: flagellar protein FlaG [SAR324 cluster bacterium]|nr:flagellar protein FlaG [SAR324 cluster bacterium]